LRVPLDLLVKARGVERFEPVTELRKLLGRKLGDGAFDLLKFGH
jgi:hypothetical protein